MRWIPEVIITSKQWAMQWATSKNLATRRTAKGINWIRIWEGQPRGQNGIRIWQGSRYGKENDQQKKGEK